MQLKYFSLGKSGTKYYLGLYSFQGISLQECFLPSIVPLVYFEIKWN